MIHNTDFITNFIFVENSVTPCEVILVPGGSRPQLAQTAAELYKNGFAKYILFSGHANYRIPQFSSEAEYLKTIAVNEGVPAANIICEPKAAHTFENAEFSLGLLREKNFKLDKFILVCKAFHSRRALLTYECVFPETTEFFVTTTNDTLNPNKNNWTTTEKYVKLVMSEVEKIGKYFGGKIYRNEEKN
jgi:uncharacterized SAM-binding protein YcdF (DUF218 family)